MADEDAERPSPAPVSYATPAQRHRSNAARVVYGLCGFLGLGLTLLASSIRPGAGLVQAIPLLAVILLGLGMAYYFFRKAFGR
jgi:hypothetical protein